MVPGQQRTDAVVALEHHWSNHAAAMHVVEPALPLATAMATLLAAPEAQFSLAIGSAEPDATSEAVQALQSLESHLCGGTAMWSIVEPLLDRCVGKKRGGQRHSRGAALLGWLIEHEDLGTAAADALTTCLHGPPEHNRLKLSAATLLHAIFDAARVQRRSSMLRAPVAVAILRGLCASVSSGPTGAAAPAVAEVGASAFQPPSTPPQPTRLALAAADAAAAQLAWACRPVAQGCIPARSQIGPDLAIVCLAEARGLCARLAHWRHGQLLHTSAVAELVAALPQPPHEAANTGAAPSSAEPSGTPSAHGDALLPAARRLWGTCAPLLQSDASVTTAAAASRRVQRWLQSAATEASGSGPRACSSPKSLEAAGEAPLEDDGAMHVALCAIALQLAALPGPARVEVLQSVHAELYPLVAAQCALSSSAALPLALLQALLPVLVSGGAEVGAVLQPLLDNLQTADRASDNAVALIAQLAIAHPSEARCAARQACRFRVHRHRRIHEPPRRVPRTIECGPSVRRRLRRFSPTCSPSSTPLWLRSATTPLQSSSISVTRRRSARAPRAAMWRRCSLPRCCRA